ncbi:GntR family transcriptional regulator, partial [Micromonospora sp. CPCC 205371]|nr:GntR family transcriptional regulator [Micromonospora sp. CPCC 205371]
PPPPPGRPGPGWVSTLLLRLFLRLWQDQDVAAAVAAAGESYDRRREALRAALGARGRTGINVWVPVPDETRAVTTLRDLGYAVAPGALYRQSSPQAVRITVSRLAETDIAPLVTAVMRAAGGAGSGIFSA